jgi:hypothetical protein
VAVAVSQVLTFGLAAWHMATRFHVSFRGVRPLLAVALCGWTAVAGLLWMGADGLASGLVLVVGILFWQAFLLRPGEWSLARRLAGLALSRGVPHA